MHILNAEAKIRTKDQSWVRRRVGLPTWWGRGKGVGTGSTAEHEEIIFMSKRWNTSSANIDSRRLASESVRDWEQVLSSSWKVRGCRLRQFERRLKLCHATMDLSCIQVSVPSATRKGSLDMISSLRHYVELSRNDAQLLTMCLSCDICGMVPINATVTSPDKISCSNLIIFSYVFVSLSLLS